MTAASVFVESIRPHPMSGYIPGYEGVWNCTVQRRGKVYTCTWRRDEAPTEAEVLAAWNNDRGSFTPGY